MTFLKSVLIFALFCEYCSGIKLHLRGSAYISYDLRSRRISAETNHISFGFKTFHPSGLILYSSGTQGDFVKIDLVDGHLRLMLDMGSIRGKSGEHSTMLGANLSDNNWHSVKVTRKRRDLTVALDNTTKASTVPGIFVRLDLDRLMYIGGVDKSLSDGQHGVDTARGFVGCLRDVVFDSIDLLYGARDRLSGYKTQGSLEYSCPWGNYVPISFPMPNSRLLLSDASLTNFYVHLNFRSYHSEGVLVSRLSTNAFVDVKLSGGKLQLSVDIRPDKLIAISVGENLHDGMWHDVTAGVNNREMWLQLDGKPEVRHSNPELARIGNFWSALHIAYDSRKTGFVGCMHNISISGVAINPLKLDSSFVKEAVVNQCGISSRCFPNPCLNGGKCLQTWMEHRCDCLGTFYTGPRCEAPLYQATCEQYRRLGMSQDAYCKVDPDGVGPLKVFEVLCNMSTADSATTIINHDKPKRRKVTAGALKVDRYFFQQITYSSSPENIRALIGRSARCRQFVSFECFKSGLLNAPGGEADVQWLSSQSELQNYWGVAHTERSTCACGLTDSCVDATKFCNCDIRDDRWHEDSGYLSDKTSLPVKMLQFSIATKHSYFTVGPLECFGSAGSASGTVSRPTFISSACRLLNPPSTPTEPWVQTTSSRIRSTQRRRLVPTSTEVERDSGVTVTTTIASNSNSTLVTSVIRQNTKSSTKDGVTVESSISSDRDGVTVHSTIKTKGERTMLPPVRSKKPGVVIYRNATVEHVTRVKEWDYDEKFIILVTTSILAFILLIGVVVVIHLKRTGRSHGFRCCTACWSCRKKRNIPDIQVYRHSIQSESPDVLQLDDIHDHSGRMEIEAYTLNGQAVYNTLHRGAHVKKNFDVDRPHSSEWTKNEADKLIA